MHAIGNRALRSLVCAAVLGACAHATAEEPDISGYWLATIERQARELRLLVHVPQAGAADQPSVTSIDRDNEPRPLTRASVEAGEVVFEGATLEFQGRLVSETSIAGAIRTGGGEIPVTFARVAEPPRLHRPQEPTGQLPYLTEEVAVDAPGSVRLAGTLTRPRGAGPFGAVLLVSGSGPQDRDHSMFGHRPFLVLADHLTRAGYAVLRLDDRGAGASTGSRQMATVNDYVDDALAAVQWLAARDDVHSVFIVGHSEGGVVAPLVASRSGAVAGLVLLGAPAMGGRALAMLQQERIARAGGAPEASIAFQQRLNARLFDILAGASDEAQARAEIRAVVAEELTALGPAAAAQTDAFVRSIEPQIRRGLSPWYRHFLSYDPAVALQTTTLPVLMLYGSLDRQAPPDANAPLAEAALQRGGARHEIVVLPGLNHLFQTAQTGAMSEYGRIEETISPTALEAIASWLNRTVEPR